MKLKRLEIEGFRSLRQIVWEPGNLNILIGPNAGGKSNLLKAFELVAAAAGRNLGDYIQQQGGMEPLVWDGQPSGSIRFATDIQLAVDGSSKQFHYTLKFSRRKKSSAFEIDEESLYHPMEGAPSPNRRLFHRTGRTAVTAEGDTGKFMPVASDVLDTDDRTLLSQVATPLVGNASYMACGRYLGGWISYQSFRTDTEAEVRRSSVARAARVLESDGQNLANLLHTLYSNDPRFKDEIDKAMHAAFPGQYRGLAISPDDAADQRIQLKVHWNGLKRAAPASDLSDGTLRYLFLISILANPNPPPLIAIDEPEIGLHPSMMTLVAETAASAAERTQVVLTTHSSEFLDSFSEASVKPSVFVVETHDGATNIKPVADDRLTHWLKEYKLGELFRRKQLEAMS